MVSALVFRLGRGGKRKLSCTTSLTLKEDGEKRLFCEQEA